MPFRLSLVLAAALAALAPAADGAPRPPRLAVSDARVVEGDAGTRTAVFVVRRSGSAARASSVRYATVRGSATRADFVPAAGRLRFGPGRTRRTVVVRVRGDRRAEPTETFALRLFSPAGARIARARARGSIVDDDRAGTPSPAPVVRFAALGDTGRGNAGQYAVAEALRAKCAAAGCEYVLGLGDNIYESGVTSPADPQLETKFRAPYAGIPQNFWMLLGNHDYGATDGGFDVARADAQVNYTYSPQNEGGKWRMPTRVYRRTDKHVEFFTLDTTPAMYRAEDAQRETVASWIASSAATWKIALGHHPYRSNGQHGNAGTYEGVPGTGSHVQALLDGAVCGKADLYIAGHDHNLQWLAPSAGTCGGTELVVSGAGATIVPFNGRTHSPALFQTDAKLGFLYVVIRGRQLTAEFVDTTGATLYTRTITR